MRPIKAQSIVGAALGVSAVLGLPLLPPRSGGPVPPTGTETSIVDNATTDTVVLSSTTLVASSTAPPSSSDSTAVDSSTVPDTTADTTIPTASIVVAATGDMSCPLGDPVTPTKCQAATVSDALLREPELAQLFALGDLQYYDFAFVSSDGTVVDQGSGTCHAPPPPPPDSTTTVAPPPPASPSTT